MQATMMNTKVGTSEGLSSRSLVLCDWFYDGEVRPLAVLCLVAIDSSTLDPEPHVVVMNMCSIGLSR